MGSEMCIRDRLQRTIRFLMWSKNQYVCTYMSTLILYIYLHRYIVKVINYSGKECFGQASCNHLRFYAKVGISSMYGEEGVIEKSIVPSLKEENCYCCP